MYNGKIKIVHCLEERGDLQPQQKISTKCKPSSRSKQYVHKQVQKAHITYGNIGYTYRAYEQHTMQFSEQHSLNRFIAICETLFTISIKS